MSTNSVIILALAGIFVVFVGMMLGAQEVARRLPFAWMMAGLCIGMFTAIFFWMALAWQPIHEKQEREKKSASERRGGG